MPLNLLTATTAFLEHHQILTPPPQTIGVAVSAGADSVVLLHLLYQLRTHFACNLHILHVNHHLRAGASDADELFVRHLATELGLPITVEHTAAPPAQIEQETRNLRRAFFLRATQDLNLNAIALGHTRSDQAETVLFRLLRGAGLTGLSAMRPVAKPFFRPLLAFSRDEIRAWATSQNIQWRDDASNLDTTFTRNRIRLETLPTLSATYNPNLEALLAQSATLAQTEEDFWQLQIQSLFPALVAATPLGLQLSVAKLTPLHLALQRRLIRHALTHLRGNLNGLDFSHVESILNLCLSTEGHNRVIIPGVDALRSFDQLLLSPIALRAQQERNYQLPLTPGVELELPYHSGFLSVQIVNSDNSSDTCANFKNEKDKKVEISYLNGDLLSASGTLPSLCVRNWLPGDAFQRPGHQSAEKIKTLFQSGKVLLWERKHWPVVFAGDEIVWVRQFGASAKFIPADGSRHIVRLIYRQSPT